MQHITAGQTWVEWLDANADEADDVKLTALREAIFITATRHLSEFSPEWANKKLRKLGVESRIYAGNAYVLKAEGTGTMRMAVHATSRAEALDQFTARLAQSNVWNLSDVQISGAADFESGPEDEDTAPDPAAPTTVQATLDMLREVILLAVISGPKVCIAGADRVLDQFGLAPVPQTREFVVTRPVQATMRTVVEAFDEESAQRVAGWRWDDGRAKFEVAEVSTFGDAEVDVN